MTLDKNVQENSKQHLNKKRSNPPISISNLLPPALWLLFVGNLVNILYFFPNMPQWTDGNILQINGFTFLIWTTVSFFSAIVSSYAKNYLKGFVYRSKFMWLCLGFTLSVMTLVMANHLALVIASWLLMGVFMSFLIGVNAEWKEAQEAFKFTLRYFLAGSLCLAIGLLLLAFQSNTFTINGILSTLETIPDTTVFIATLFIIIAALIQSAIYPFHRWLLSAMTSPTPASALMHAGFVNGSGILLALFASLLYTSHILLDILLIIGGLTAIIAQFTKLLQVNVKQKLACSTIAQMGFMIMQCGLGFFNAAVVHLILHGFYKAYLFLSSGEEIAATQPQNPPEIRIKPLQALVVLIFGVLGAGLFALFTGKGTELDSGIFLTLIVAITVGQVTYNIVKEKKLSLSRKIILPPVLFFSGIGIYALLYNGVTLMMADMPMVAVALPLSIVQIIFGIIFLIGFFIMKLGVYRKIPWLYVKLLNLSQPNKKSIVFFKSNA